MVFVYGVIREVSCLYKHILIILPQIVTKVIKNHNFVK
jgi:hypothetical protein